ncbi:MAG: M23 family metallopeptidase [Elusimicrobiota bacterium]|jgi:murein DD-endopeptidase MepM/ murein hydrolase activator NlpD|nr:M23 family metallopeptidase [Elusimicrobiota bacterium]
MVNLKAHRFTVIFASLFVLFAFQKYLYAQEDKKPKFVFWSPILGKPISSHFGNRKHPITGELKDHKGVDIAVAHGTWISAAADGKVIFAGNNLRHYGKAVFIAHKHGYVTHYGHLSHISVYRGQAVNAGQYIGKSGATGRVTGPHLHFTLIKNGEYVNPSDYIELE